MFDPQMSLIKDSLIYFMEYNSIAQVCPVRDNDQLHYSNDVLIYMLQFNHYFNVAKWLVKYLDDKSLLKKYLFKYSSDIQWVELMLSFNLISESDDKHQLLIACCRYGHLKLVKWLVSEGVDIAFKNYYAFRSAYEWRNLEILKYLLNLIDSDEEKKKCIACADNFPLRRPILQDDIEIIKWLASEGIDIRFDDYLPFRVACTNGHLEAAKYLLELITDDDEKKRCVRSNNDYALKWSAHDGHLEAVKWLLSLGADVRTRNCEPFQFACIGGQLEIAKYILSLIDDRSDNASEKLKCIGIDYIFVLELSLSNGHLEVVKWLVSMGTDVRARNYLPFQTDVWK